MGSSSIVLLYILAVLAVIIGLPVTVITIFELSINTSLLSFITKDKSPDILSAMPVFTSHDIQATYKYTSKSSG